MGRLLAGGPTERWESICRRKDGSLVDVLITVSPSLDENGAVTGLSMIAQDISERVAAQQALEASERRLAEAQRIAQIGSFEVDPVTEAMTWSEEHLSDSGNRPELPAEQRAVPVGDSSRRRARTRRGLADGGEPTSVAVDIGYRIIRADTGERAQLERPVRTGAWAPTAPSSGWPAPSMDDTDRLAADLERRTAESRFEVAFEQAGIGTGILGLDGIPTRVNAAGCAILGRPMQELTGRSWVEYNHPDELPLGEVMLPWLAEGHDSYSAERRFLRPGRQRGVDEPAHDAGPSGVR